MLRFKDLTEAKMILCEKIGGTSLRSHIWIGEDCTVELRLGDKLQATVNAADHEFQKSGRAPWCAVGVKASANCVQKGTTAFSGYRPEYYEADIDVLAAKVLKLAEQFKGSHEKALALRKQSAETQDAQLQLRTEYVPRLIELGLAAWEEIGEMAQYPYVIERRKMEMKPISVKGHAVHVFRSGRCLNS